MNQKPIDFDEEFMIPRDVFRKIAAERDALLLLVADLHKALEFARTRERPSYAYEYLFGKKSTQRKHAVLLELDKVVGSRTVLSDQPDPPYPHRTRVCAGCGTAVYEDDLADDNLCHICIKS